MSVRGHGMERGMLGASFLPGWRRGACLCFSPPSETSTIRAAAPKPSTAPLLPISGEALGARDALAGCFQQAAAHNWGELSKAALEIS